MFEGGTSLPGNKRRRRRQRPVSRDFALSPACGRFWEKNNLLPSMFDGYALFEFSELIRLHVIRKKCINQLLAVSCTATDNSVWDVHMGHLETGSYSWEGRHEMGLYYFGMMAV